MMGFKYNVCGKIVKRSYTMGTHRFHRFHRTEYETMFEFESDYLLDSTTKEVLISGIKYEVEDIIIDLSKNSMSILVNKIIREECDSKNIEKFISEFVCYVKETELKPYKDLIKFLEDKYPKAYIKWLNK